MQKYNHTLQNRAHQNFFFSDTISFWIIHSLRGIHLIISGKVLEHESKAGLFPGSVLLELSGSRSVILQMDVRRWKTMSTEWSGLYSLWDSLKHLPVSNLSGLLQRRYENWESGSSLVEPGDPASFLGLDLWPSALCKSSLVKRNLLQDLLLPPLLQAPIGQCVLLRK